MTSKYDQIMRKLSNIEGKLEVMGKYILPQADEFEEELDEQSEDFTEDEIAAYVTQQREDETPRTRFRVRGVDGEYEVNWNDLDPRVQQAIEESNELGSDYQLYEDNGGRIRITIDSKTASSLVQKRKGHRDNQPNP